MSDHTYTRFTVPLSVLADATLSEVVRTAFGLSTAEFQAAILTNPEPDEAAGYEGTTVRLVDGRPCLVYEDPDCDCGGSEIAADLSAAGVPYLQAHATGDEYGPTATAWLPGDSETIRLSHDLAPVIGIGVIDGRVALDQQEIRDFERYQQIRRAVLLWPAAPARHSPAA
jgi:hypothetical protein